MTEKQLDCVLDMMRRLPPQLSSKHLDQAIDLVPDLWEDLYQSVDTPIQVKQDTSGRRFLCNSYNQDGDSHRSHWDNKYYPKLDDGIYPPSHLRNLEMDFNNIFSEYVKQYYRSDNALSSIYLFESAENSNKNDFNGIILIKNQIESADPSNGGTWDSIHLFEVTHDSNNKANYKTTSTVLLYMTQQDQNVGLLNLSGNFTIVREFKKNPVTVKSNGDHIKSIGSMIEDVENNMRASIQEIYFSKTKYGFDSCRSSQRLESNAQKIALAKSLQSKMGDKSKIASKRLL